MISLQQLRDYNESVGKTVWVHAIDNFLETLAMQMITTRSIDKIDYNEFYETGETIIQKKGEIAEGCRKDIFFELDYTQTCVFEELPDGDRDIESWGCSIDAVRFYLANNEFDLSFSEKIKNEFRNILIGNV